MMDASFDWSNTCWMQASLLDWRFNQTLSGVPQGSIVSPILSNILLDKLDHYVETVLIPRYTRGEKRSNNPEYKRLMYQAEKRFKRGETSQGQQFRKAAQHLPSYDQEDPTYRRLHDCRYADDVRHLTRY